MTADCLTLCGNAYEPEVHVTYEGSHADNFRTVIADTAEFNEAISDWIDVMKAARGDDWLLNTKFNCDHTYDPVARKALARLKVERVTVLASAPPAKCPR